MGSIATRNSYLTHIGVRRRKYKLRELLKVEQLVHRAVILLNHSIDILKLRAHKLLFHKIVKLAARNLIVVVDIESIEKLHWLKLRMACQILPPQLDQSLICRQISEQLSNNAINGGKLEGALNRIEFGLSCLIVCEVFIEDPFELFSEQVLLLCVNKAIFGKKSVSDMS